MTIEIPLYDYTKFDSVGSWSGTASVTVAYTKSFYYKDLGDEIIISKKDINSLLKIISPYAETIK